MSQAQERPRVTPRVVSSIEAAMAQRRAPQSPAGGDTRAAEQLLRAMHTVKSARFNAAERFERKHMISLFAMSMVSLYFVGLSVWQAIYSAQIGDAANRLITLVSIMSSVFTLVLALIESMNDYKMKAHHMHACALAVNDLYHELKVLHTSDASAVQEFRRRYNEAVRGCPFNHARIDYLMAKAEQGMAWSERAWVHVRYASDVYALYGMCLLIPPLVLVLWA
jgi:SMODS and SLOG-associating 2TM effector domain family 5